MKTNLKTVLYLESTNHQYEQVVRRHSLVAGLLLYYSQYTFMSAREEPGSFRGPWFASHAKYKVMLRMIIVDISVAV